MPTFEFNLFRTELWRVLRAEFPTRPDPRNLAAEPIGESEGVTAFLSRHRRKWREETGEDPEVSPLMTMMFRTSVIEGLPVSVKNKLEDVVGLHAMAHLCFGDHVSHVMERFRKDEKKEKDQEKDIMLKVAKLQLGELTEKGKKKSGKIQAPVSGEQVEVISQDNVIVSGGAQNVAQPPTPQVVSPSTQVVPVSVQVISPGVQVVPQNAQVVSPGVQVVTPGTQVVTLMGPVMAWPSWGSYGCQQPPWQASNASYECFNKTKGNTPLENFPGRYDVIWHIDENSHWDADTPDRKSWEAAGTIANLSVVTAMWQGCENRTTGLPKLESYRAQDAVADFFWLCKGKQLRLKLPGGWTGLCARVKAVQEVAINKWDEKSSQDKKDEMKGKDRYKRDYRSDPAVALDSIGQPRGIPNEFKARSEVAAGFKSIFLWPTSNKNVEWINYIYHNQQRFINYTDACGEGFYFYYEWGYVLCNF